MAAEPRTPTKNAAYVYADLYPAHSVDQTMSTMWSVSSTKTPGTDSSPPRESRKGWRRSDGMRGILEEFRRGRNIDRCF